MSATSAVTFRTFQPGDEVPFRELNEIWIQKFFVLEEPDRKVLGDPVGYILEPGGQIVLAVRDGEVIGCCALLAMDNGVFEVAKMTVREDNQGRGVGKLLLKAVIDCGASIGARSLYLESSHKLHNAIHVYESLGFRHLPPERIHPSPYNRADVFMERAF